MLLYIIKKDHSMSVTDISGEKLDDSVGYFKNVCR